MIAAPRGKWLICVAMPWLLALAGCASSVSRDIIVNIDGIGMEYTSGQIRSYLDTHGYKRVIINHDIYGDQGLYMVRTSETEIMHFRSRSYPDRLIVTHLDKKYKKIYIRFTEEGVNRITPAALEDFNQILAAISERVSAERVEAQWW